MVWFRNVLFFAVCVLLPACTASAHERRETAEGLSMVVGFLTEPAFSGQMNGVDFKVSRAGKPVEGLAETLKAAVSRLDSPQTLELPFKARYKQPGSYAAYFLPAKPGRYIFHITGEIDGKPVDETFTSGPDSFGDVVDSEPLRFPPAG